MTFASVNERPLISTTSPSAKPVTSSTVTVAPAVAWTTAEAAAPPLAGCGSRLSTASATGRVVTVRSLPHAPRAFAVKRSVVWLAGGGAALRGWISTKSPREDSTGVPTAALSVTMPAVAS